MALAEKARAGGKANYAKWVHAHYARLTQKGGQRTTASGSVATMSYRGVEKGAGDPEEVGALVSEYTAMVSGEDTTTGFDDAFRGEVEAAVADFTREGGYHGEDHLALNRPITEGEVRKALKAHMAKLYKSPGPDGVMNWMLVWGGDAVVKALLALYTAVWESGVIPPQWAEAHVTYLYKGAGKKSEISNYRPISLTSVIAKVFTKILQPRLEKVLHPGLSPFQGCGKKGSGAMEHL